MRICLFPSNLFLAFFLYSVSICAQRFPLTYDFAEQKVVYYDSAIKINIKKDYCRIVNCKNIQASNAFRDCGISDQLYRGLSHHSLPNKLTKKHFDSIYNVQNQIDSVNIQFLNNFVKSNGWPNCMELGLENTNVMFFIIQHSSIEYQKRYLPQIQKYCQSKCLEWGSYAHLYDRILINEGKQQYYGTQLTVDQITGEELIMPISDKAKVDLRRKEMGMHPILTEYENELGMIVLPHRIMD